MRLAAGLIILLLAGCAVLRPGAGESVQVSDIVGAAVVAARAAPEEQRRQLNHAGQMYAALPDDANRARLAVLLATLPAPLRDDARAAALLEPLAARRPDTPLVQFAGLLAAGAAERQRLARDLRAAEKREEAAEERASRLARDLRAAEKREEAAEERASTLRQQVDALKSIERGILEREERRRKTNR
jgi:hypothetical protein